MSPEFHHLDLADTLDALANYYERQGDSVHLDKMGGGDFEKGLAQMKPLAEGAKK